MKKHIAKVGLPIALIVALGVTSCEVAKEVKKKIEINKSLKQK